MRQRSLRFRITLTLFLFVSLGSALFALATYVVNEYQEAQVLDDTLQEEFEEYERLYQLNPVHPPPSSSTLRSFLVGPEEKQALPAELWGLGLGTHHDIDVNGGTYHVLNREIGDRRLYLMYEITRIERRESIFSGILLVGVLVASLLALWAGYLLSGRLIKPVTDLADRVSHLHPGQRSAPLAFEFSDTEVAVIAKAFDQFLARLDQFIIREHAFTEDASHELRTPLAVISSASELLLADPQATTIRQPLLRIQRASRQMTRLTRALLILARETDAHEAHAEVSQADTIIAETVESHRHLYTDSPVRIVLDVAEPTRLSLVPELLEIVVANLLQNALAHTREGQVRVALARSVLTVEDTGSGIRPEDMPRIFERNYRDPGSRGLGRGLDLVKRICDRCGWRVEVSSQLGQGTRFTVNLDRSGKPG